MLQSTYRDQSRIVQKLQHYRYPFLSSRPKQHLLTVHFEHLLIIKSELKS